MQQQQQMSHLNWPETFQRTEPSAWIDAIDALHGSTTATGYLYRVTEVTDESTLQ